MGRIDIGRVLLGGIVAGVIITIGEMIANMWLFVEHNQAIMERLDVAEPGGAQIAFFTVISFMVGITMIWLYAAIRPRYGPGPGTAICAALFTWALFYLFPMLMWTAVGVVSTGATVTFAIWGAVQLVVAALAGGMLYQEEEVGGERVDTAPPPRPEVGSPETAPPGA